MEELTKFLKGQEILQIAPAAGNPWIANVYICCKELEKIYFIGTKETLYAKKLIENPLLAFATAWHSEGDHTNRKGIQGVGNASIADNDEDIVVGVWLHNKNYPEFAEDITVKHIQNNITDTCLWVIKPTYIKFWSDEDYGENGAEEFKF